MTWIRLVHLTHRSKITTWPNSSNFRVPPALNQINSVHAITHRTEKNIPIRCVPRKLPSFRRTKNGQNGSTQNTMVCHKQRQKKDTNSKQNCIMNTIPYMQTYVDDNLWEVTSIHVKGIKKNGQQTTCNTPYFCWTKHGTNCGTALLYTLLIDLTKIGSFLLGRVWINKHFEITTL